MTHRDTLRALAYDSHGVVTLDEARALAGFYSGGGSAFRVTEVVKPARHFRSHFPT